MATANNSTGPTRNTASSRESIAEQLAQRFGHNPNVIGWQIDNEYADAILRPRTQKQFQDWLQSPLQVHSTT